MQASPYHSIIQCGHILTSHPQDELSWGFSSLIREDAILARVKAFRESLEAIDASQDVIIVPPGPPSATTTYRLRGSLVIRFVSAASWEKSSADMIRNPSKYLYLDTAGALSQSKPAVMF
jgi:hypothetical protein